VGNDGGMMGRAFKFWDLVSSILTRLPWGRIGNNYSKIEMTTLFISRLVQYTKKNALLLLFTQNLPIFQFCVTYTVMKYKVRLSTVAFVSQDVEVEADSMEDAENKVFENEMWNDEQWNYNRRSSDILEVDDVEVANA
jgi:hypothetical protein